MNKEQKYTSLPLSKKIYDLAKKKGIVLESEYCWGKPKKAKTIWVLVKKIKNGHCDWDYIPALDTAELGEILPKNIKTYWLVIIKFGGHSTIWSVRYMENIIGKGIEKWHWNKMDESMPDAMGKMYFYLLVNNLL